MKQEIMIRTAKLEDAERLLAIYAPYVEKTAITFEYEVPSLEEFQNRIQHVLETYPYLVAIQNEEIVGYAYAGRFKARAAYDWAVETSIYVDQNKKHSGIGRMLHEELERLLQLQGILNMNACISYPSVEDEYLDKNSVGFHKHLGYRMVGEFQKCGFKFNRWYNMVWMEKHIGEHHPDQLPPKTFQRIQTLE